MSRMSIRVFLWTATLGALVLTCASMNCRETMEDRDGCTTTSLTPPHSGDQCRIDLSSSTFFVKPQSSFRNFKVQSKFSKLVNFQVNRNRLSNLHRWYKITFKRSTTLIIFTKYELFIDDHGFHSFQTLSRESPQIEILVTGSMSYGPNCRSYPHPYTKAPTTTTTTTTTASTPTTKITEKVTAATTQVSPSTSFHDQGVNSNSTSMSMVGSPASDSIAGLDRWVFVILVIVSALLIITILAAAVVLRSKNKQKAKTETPSSANMNEIISSQVLPPSNNIDDHVYEEIHEMAGYTLTTNMWDNVPRGSQPTSSSEQRIHHDYANTIFEYSDLHYQNVNARPSMERRHSSHDSENSLYGAIV